MITGRVSLDAVHGLIRRVARIGGRSHQPHPAFLGNALEMAIALRGLGLSCLARYRRGARWHDDRSLRIAVEDGAIDAVLVVGTVASKETTDPFHLIEKGADLGGVIDIVRRQCGGADVPVLASMPMQLSPG
jgi:hypothetical protein